MGLKIQDFSKMQPALAITPAVVNEAFDRQDMQKILEIIDAEEVEITNMKIGDLDTPTGTFRFSYIPYTDDNAWVYGKIYDLASVVNEEAFFFNTFDMVENIVYMEFNENDFLLTHFDLGNEPPYVGRKLTAVINLSGSDNYRGGQYNVMSSDVITTSRSAGDCTFYPSYLASEITTVTSGTKKVLIAFFGGSNLE